MISRRCFRLARPVAVATARSPVAPFAGAERGDAQRFCGAGADAPGMQLIEPIVAAPYCT